MSIIIPTQSRLGAVAGLTASRLLGTGATWPLAGIIDPALAFQICNGFGPDPFSNKFVWVSPLPAQVSFPIDASLSDPYLIRVTTLASDLVYSFATLDPGGTVYLGPSSGNSTVDATTLVNAINLNQTELTAFSFGGTVSLQTVAAGVAQTISVHITDGVTNPSYSGMGANTRLAVVDDGMFHWDDFDRSAPANQSNTINQPLLAQWTDGKFYANADGNGKFMNVLTMGGQVTYVAGMRSNTAAFNAYFAAIEGTVYNGGGNRWAVFNRDDTNMFAAPFPVAANRNGIDLTSPFDLSPIDEWFMIAIKTSVADAPVLRALFQLDSVSYGNAGMSCLFIDPLARDPSSDDIQKVMRFGSSITPDNPMGV